MDPLEFRLKNLKDERLRAVFQAAADKFGWGKQKAAPGHGFGIGGGFEKGERGDLRRGGRGSQVGRRCKWCAWSRRSIAAPW